jgi:hypothetical protein
MADQEERRARNEALFREVNERIEDAARAAPIDVAQFLCECSNTSCDTVLEVPIAEYEAVRAIATRFIVAPGHESRDIEHVVERRAGYVVVEKHGRAAEIAAETAPRN